MTKWVDVSDGVLSVNIDDEHCSIGNCPVCKTTFGYWEFVLSIYPDSANSCPKCGALMYFRNDVKVYAIQLEET